MTIETYPEMNTEIVEILRLNKDHPMLLYAAQRIEELEAEVERAQRRYDSLRIRFDATQRVLTRLQCELRAEQVQRNKWERICEETGLADIVNQMAELEPTPDAMPCGYNPPPANLAPPEKPPPPRPSDVLPCGHPRSAIRGDVTHWCAMCEEEATNDRT